MEAKDLNAVDRLIPHIAMAIQMWHDKNTPESITQTVHEKLDEQATAVLQSLMGFRKSWGGAWEVDTTNGRNESAAAVFFKEHQNAAMLEWLRQIPLPTLTEKLKKQIAKDIQQTYEHAFSNYVRDHVYKRAQKDAEALLDELIKPKQLENYKKVVALITPKPDPETN